MMILGSEPSSLSVDHRPITYGNGSDTDTDWVDETDLARIAVRAQAEWRWNCERLAAAALDRVRTIQATTKAEVFEVVAGSASYLVKVHQRPMAFLREMFALRLLGHGDARVCPALVHSDEELGLIVTEYIPDACIVADAAGFAEVFSALGRLHAEATRHCDLLREAAGDITLGAYAADFARSARFRRPDCFRAALRIMLDELGSEHVSCVVLDLKREHARRRADGSIAFCDFETFTAGLPELFDLLQALNVAIPTYRPTRHDWKLALAHYLFARDGTYCARSVDRYYRAIELTAAAFALERYLP